MKLTENASRKTQTIGVGFFKKLRNTWNTNWSLVTQTDKPIK